MSGRVQCLAHLQQASAFFHFFTMLKRDRRGIPIESFSRIYLSMPPARGKLSQPIARYPCGQGEFHFHR